MKNNITENINELAMFVDSIYETIRKQLYIIVSFNPMSR